MNYLEIYHPGWALLVYVGLFVLGIGWIFSIAQVAFSGIEPNLKIFWLLVILLVPVFGMVFYWIGQGQAVAVRQFPKPIDPPRPWPTPKPPQLEPPLIPAEEYFTCTCQHCPVQIEFPLHGVGEEIECPHCGMTTVLRAPVPI